jgi:mercuric ion transport protein
MLLGSFGLGSAGLFELALLAAPHRTALLATAAACLTGGAILLWRRRTVAVACAPGTVCPSNPTLRYVTAGGLAVGAVLLVLGYA